MSRSRTASEPPPEADPPADPVAAEWAPPTIPTLEPDAVHRALVSGNVRTVLKALADRVEGLSDKDRHDIVAMCRGSIIATSEQQVHQYQANAPAPAVILANLSAGVLAAGLLAEATRLVSAWVATGPGTVAASHSVTGLKRTFD